MLLNSLELILNELVSFRWLDSCSIFCI